MFQKDMPKGDTDRNFVLGFVEPSAVDNKYKPGLQIVWDSEQISNFTEVAGAGLIR